MTRTKLGLLNVLGALLDQGVRNLVTVFLTPVLLEELGRAGFGAWQALGRSAQQIGSLDGRAPEVLKWHIAREVENEDHEKKREIVGASLQIVAWFSPLLAILFGLWIWWSPSLLTESPNSSVQIRLVASVLALTTVANSFMLLFDAALRGLNRGYKRVGIQSGLMLAGGLAAIYVARCGGGLLGVSVTYLLIAVLQWALLATVVQRTFAWFGASFVPLRKLVTFLPAAGWYTAGGFVETGLSNADVILLSLIKPESTVADYVVARFAPQLIPVFVVTVTAALLPGMVGKVGSEPLRSGAALREELTDLARVFAVFLTCLTLIANPTFLTCWLGTAPAATSFEIALISIGAFQLAMAKVDSYFLHAFLSLSGKVFAGAASLVFLAGASVIAVPMYSIVGLCFAVVLSRGLLSLCYLSLANRKFEHNPFSLRTALASSTILAISGLVGWRLPPVDSWQYLTGLVLTASLIVGPACYYIILDGPRRDVLSGRLYSVFNRR